MWQQHNLTWFHVVMSFNNLQRHKLCFIRIWRNDCIPLIQFLQTQDDQSMLCWLAPRWGHSTQVASWCWLEDPVVSHTQCGSPTLRLSMRPQSIPRHQIFPSQYKDQQQRMNTGVIITIINPRKSLLHNCTTSQHQRAVNKKRLRNPTVGWEWSHWPSRLACEEEVKSESLSDEDSSLTSVQESVSSS